MIPTSACQVMRTQRRGFSHPAAPGGDASRVPAVRLSWPPPMDQKKQIFVWLQAASALEQTLGQVLTRQTAAAAHQERMKTRLEQHLAEPRQHAEVVAHCLDRLDAKPSLAKAAGAMMLGAME